MLKVSLRWFIQRKNWREYLVRWNVSEREWWIFDLDLENVDGCNGSVQLRWKRTRISQWWKEINQGKKGGSWSCYCWSWKYRFIGFLKKKNKQKNERNEKQQQQRASVADAWKGIDRGNKGGFTKLLFWKHRWLDLKVAKINIPAEQRWIHEDIVSIAWVYIKKAMVLRQARIFQKYPWA